MAHEWIEAADKHVSRATEVHGVKAAIGSLRQLKAAIGSLSEHLGSS